MGVFRRNRGISLVNFAVRRLAPGMMLVTYRVVQRPAPSTRERKVVISSPICERKSADCTTKANTLI